MIISNDKFRGVRDEWAEWAIVHPDFGRSVNPISTRGSRLCPPHYYLPTQLYVASYAPAYRGNSGRNDQVKYNHLSNKKGLLYSMLFQISTDSYSLFRSSLVLQVRVLEY